MTQQSSSSTREMRGSSRPHSSSGCSGDGARAGVSPMAQPVTPSADRATLRWEKPRRSSTRQSSTVSPSTRVAPAFMTALTAYGQRAGSSSGLPGGRVKSRSLATVQDPVVDREVVVDHAGGREALDRPPAAGGAVEGRGPIPRIDGGGAPPDTKTGH